MVQTHSTILPSADLAWEQQPGICPVRHQKITPLTGWDKRHIVERVAGGGAEAENRVLPHPNCHRPVHSQELEVAKPRPIAGERKAGADCRERGPVGAGPTYVRRE